MKEILIFIKKYFWAALFFIASQLGYLDNLEERIPNFYVYVLVILIGTTFVALYRSINNNNRITMGNNSIFLTTNNDYAQKATMLVLSFVAMGTAIYFLFYSTYFDKLNVSLFLLLSILLFINGFYVNRSLKISISPSQFSFGFKGNKRKDLPIDRIESISISNTEITLFKKSDVQEVISFLEMTNKDVLDAQSFFTRKLNCTIRVI